MDSKAHPIGEDLRQLAHDATALLAATADVAGENVAEARRRLMAACDRSYNRARESAIQGSRAADKAIRANPYPSIAIGLGAGAVIGYLIARSCQCQEE